MLNEKPRHKQLLTQNSPLKKIGQVTCMLDMINSTARTRRCMEIYQNWEWIDQRTPTYVRTYERIHIYWNLDIKYLYTNMYTHFSKIFKWNKRHPGGTHVNPLLKLFTNNLLIRLLKADSKMYIRHIHAFHTIGKYCLRVIHFSAITCV